MEIKSINDLKNLFDKFEEMYIRSKEPYLNDEIHISDVAERRIVASVIKEVIEDTIKSCDEELKDKIDTTSNWTMKEYAKSLELTFKKSATINPKIVDELTNEECRKGFTVTEKAIKSVGRGELLDKYKSITESKTLTLKSLKD